MDAADFVGKYQSLSIIADMPNAPFTCTVACNKYLIATQGDIADIRAKQGNVIAAIKKGGATFDSGAAARLSNGKASLGTWRTSSAVLSRQMCCRRIPMRFSDGRTQISEWTVRGLSSLTLSKSASLAGMRR